MEYTKTSVKPVIAKIVRDIGKNNLDPGYVDSFLEWIPEAVEELQTTHELITKSTPNKDCEGQYVTKNHVVSLPMGLVYIRAVEDEYGRRLRRGSDSTDLTSPTTQSHVGSQGSFSGRATNFQTDVSTYGGTAPAVPYDGSDIVPVTTDQVKAYYKVQGGCLQTSRDEMFVKIHYDAMQIDNEGYPLIVDMHEYREAIYWYVLSKLMAAGFEHKLFSGMQGFKYVEEKYAEYCGLALGKIKLPDEDRMARLRDSFSLRLVPPVHFYDDFFVGAEQSQSIRLV